MVPAGSPTMNAGDNPSSLTTYDCLLAQSSGRLAHATDQELHWWWMQGPRGEEQLRCSAGRSRWSANGSLPSPGGYSVAATATSCSSSSCTNRSCCQASR
jgi:hypothetical protein